IMTGYERAANVARRYRMQRAFAIAPTANTSYAYTDMLGYVTTPEISPPVDREVVRVSETTDEITVTYPPTVEIASEVGWNTYWRLIDLWMQMMNSTGLAHSISSNWWSDQISMNDKFLEKWLKSSWRSLYYALPVEPAVDKSEIMCDIDCQSCAEGNSFLLAL
ncbi:MAG: ribonucleotide reductase, partial [Candidatus Gracilibacteria bacterium]